MLEWKILAAAFAALLVISMLLVGNSGVKDLFGGITGKITDWMGSNSVSIPGIGSTPGKSNTGSGNSAITVTFYPQNFTLSPGSKLNLSLGDSYFEGFSGDIYFDFSANKITLKEKSGFSFSSPTKTFTIQDIGIPRLQMKGIRFLLRSSQSNIANDNGTLDVQGFQGTFSAANDSITLSGNVTKITGDGWIVS